MLTDEEIFQTVDNVPITSAYVLAVARAIEAKVLEKLPKAELLRAADYLASDVDSLPGAEADRLSGVLRGLAL